MNLRILQQASDTIAAIATAVGEGGVGIIRISGPDALKIALQVFQPRREIKEWRSHLLYYGHCFDDNGEWLDEVMAVWMPQGRSFTGDEVVELHAHGGKLNLLQLLRRVLDCGARPADAGEFTRRAFLNGRIDLTKAEAIADLISAKNEQSLRIARHHLQGHLQNHLEELSDESLLLAAQVESWLDFPEELDPALDKAAAKLFADIRAFEVSLCQLLDSYQIGQQLKEGWSLLLLGRPNAGKSSVFNRLNGDDRAIVTSLPGTTRDLLETQIALGGVQLTLSDSAGLRKLAFTDTTTNTLSEKKQGNLPPSHDLIEQIGMDRALHAASKAHLLLAILDLSRAWSEEDEEVLSACQGREVVVVCNKSDLPRMLEQERIEAFQPLWTIELSCETGDGIESLQEQLQSFIESQTPASEFVITNERQRNALAEALQSVEKALGEGFDMGPEFMAEDLRMARNALAEITGQVSSEDVLGAIFSRFCIGK